MQEVHAVLLSGGSAFGLAAADGVMRYLEERGVGYPTPWVRVPIVPAAVVFDMNLGSRDVRPTAASGYSACEDASTDLSQQGTIGVGTGTTVGKWAGPATMMKGGFGAATVEFDNLIVTAAAAVNAVGDIVGADGRTLAGARNPDGSWVADADHLRRMRLVRPAPSPLGNTTLVAVMTNARCSKVDVNRISQRSHDGMARAIRPVHTSFDGDVVFALAAGAVESAVDIVAEMAAEATSEAIRNAVRFATTVAGIPALAGQGA
jgi:L-aminopeptidase/D-esterase-like protein